LGADRACFDAARILRPPGTWNHKHEPATPVDLVRLEADARFELGHVLAHAPAIDDAHLARRWRDRPARDPAGDPLLGISPADYVSVLLGVPARAGGKVRCPFHNDAHPSLHVYPTAERGWCCFSCGRGGSIYDLAAALMNVGTRGQDFVRLRRELTNAFATQLSRAPARARRPDGVGVRF
jgi:hypothetical protein